MKLLKNFALFLVLSFAITGTMAQENYSVSAQTTTINGTSSLHAWHENVTKVSGKCEVKQATDKSLTLQSLGIIIPVNSIKADESGMLSKTYKALKSDKFPEITFTLAEPLVSVPSAANSFSANARGHFTIAGVTKPVLLAVKISVGDDKKITVEGAQQIKMTEYGIDPPTAMLGMLKTGDIVTINFKTTFSSSN